MAYGYNKGQSHTNLPTSDVIWQNMISNYEKDPIDNLLSEKVETVLADNPTDYNITERYPMPNNSYTKVSIHSAARKLEWRQPQQ
jgi:hypothetical protein